MTKTVLPDMHYISERDRTKIHPGVVRSITIPSIPSDFPFKAPIGDERRNRGPRYTIGWLEFQSPEQPDPEVARPGDVWIQLPSGHRKARVYACYSAEGKDWSPWLGNTISLGGRGNTPMHPFLNDHSQRKFYLMFNGSEFTWANPKGVSIIMHNQPHIYSMGPAEAVIKWLKVTGVGRASPAPAEKVTRSTSAPLVNRKHAHPDHSDPPGDSASAPPAKKAKHTPSESSPDRSLAVKLGAYAKAGATQQGWIMSIDGMPLHMPFPCINCTRSKTPCSGIPGERCGRCRFKRLGCSHHAQKPPQKPRSQTATPATEAPAPATATATATVESSPTAQLQSGLTLRVPRLRPWVPDPAPSSDVNSSPVPVPRFPLRRVRIQSASVGARSDNGNDDDDANYRSSSPLSSVLEPPSELVPPHSESAMLDARDDAAVENLLDSASMAVSAMTAAQDAGDEEDEDDEFTRFMQMTLDGMARMQEGMRGVFALTRRNLKAKRTAVQKAAAGVAAAAAVVASGGGEPSSVSAMH